MVVDVKEVPWSGPDGRGSHALLCHPQCIEICGQRKCHSQSGAHSVGGRERGKEEVRKEEKEERVVEREEEEKEGGGISVPQELCMKNH